MFNNSFYKIFISLIIFLHFTIRRRNVVAPLMLWKYPYFDNTITISILSSLQIMTSSLSATTHASASFINDLL